MECMSEELELIDQDRIDKAIWKSIGIKSVRQIADETGLKPEEVLRRKNELLDEIDVLTISEVRQRTAVELQSIARKTQEDYDSAPFEFKSGLMNSAVAAMKVVLQEMNRLEKADNSKVEQLNQLRVRELGRMVEMAVKKTLKSIQDTYEVPYEEMEEMFRRHLQETAIEVEEQAPPPLG